MLNYAVFRPFWGLEGRFYAVFVWNANLQFAIFTHLRIGFSDMKELHAVESLQVIWLWLKLYTILLAMEHPDEFIKLLQQIMSKECKPLMSEEEIHFDVLSMSVMEMVGDRW